jgi:hypothetical protein
MIGSEQCGPCAAGHTPTSRRASPQSIPTTSRYQSNHRAPFNRTSSSLHGSLEIDRINYSCILLFLSLSFLFFSLLPITFSLLLPVV